MVVLTHDQQLALQMFKDGQKRIFGLTGPSQAPHRQTIMRLLTGEKLPQSKCGIHALTSKVAELDPTVSPY
jgi:hypothetical protein